MVVETKAKIIEIKKEAEEIKTFTLQLEKKINYSPGEFVLIWFNKKPEIKRAYSIANYSQNKILKLTVEKIKNGKLTTELFKAKKGDELIVKGAFGEMKYGNEEKIVMIGTGTGIAPFISFIEYFKKIKCPEKAYLFYSFKRPEKKIDLQIDYCELKEKYGVEAILTCPKAGKDKCIKWVGLKEYINAETIKKFNPELKEFTFFLCGSPKIVEQITESLLKEGISKEKIKHEKF